MSDRPQTIPQLLIARSNETPDTVAQRHKRLGVWIEFTWAEVAEQVSLLASGLIDLGMAKGETVAMIGENEPEHFWSQIAAQAAGGRAVSIYPDSTSAEVKYMLVDSDAKYLIAQDQEQVDKALEIIADCPALRSVIYWDERGLWSYDNPVLRTFNDLQELGRQRRKSHEGELGERITSGMLDDTATLCYTSGTTGAPKGVILTHRYIFDNASRLQQGLNIKPGAEYLSQIPLAWALEQISGVVLGMSVPLVVNFPEQAETIRNDTRELAVEVIVFSPRQWEGLASGLESRMLDAGKIRQWFYRKALGVGMVHARARLEGRSAPLWARFLYPLANVGVLWHVRENLGLSRVKWAMSAGTAMAPDLFRLFRALGVPIRNMYGTSEYGPVTLHQGEAFDVETVGRFLVGDPAYGPPLEWKLGENDELLLRGGAGFAGYFGKPVETAERFKNGWYATGDAVTVTESRELIFLERVSDMRVLADGHRYPPQFIETRLRSNPFIKDVMVIGDSRHAYVTALVNIDEEMCSSWAERRNVSFANFTDLSKRPEIYDLIAEGIKQVNKVLPAKSRIIRFANFPKNLDPDDGELTRSRKLKRELIEVRYGELIAALYADGLNSAKVAIPITYQGGGSGVLNADVPVMTVAILQTEHADARNVAEGTGLERSLTT
ncbi:MAG: AMP-binding protein [Pseudomonadota bacterium]